jgi:hypothetical protein
LSLRPHVGDAEKILTAPANLLARFPGVTADILALVGRLLLPSGTERTAKRGRETRMLRTPLMTAATMLGRIAARRFLEV